MDEEEELDNTLIGQEEEAPAVNTEGALMGSIPSDNLVSFINTTGQQSDAMTQLADTSSANIGVPMTGMRPIDPTTGQPLSQRVIDAANRAGLDLPQASVPLPQPASALPALPTVVADQPQAAVSPFLQSPNTPSGLGGPLLRGFEMMSDASPPTDAPMGQEATRAALGGMTLNEYLNAPAGTPGVSGLRTDPQGRMISTPAPAVVNNFAPQASGGQTGPAKVSDEIMSQITRPVPQTMEFRDANRDGVEDRQQGIFRPNELLGYDAQGNEVRAPGTQQPVNRIPATAQPPVDALSSFERESLAREARLAGRDRLPGETQAQRDTRVAQSRTQGSRLGGGLSQADLRDLAEASATGATPGEVARGLGIQQREGLGEFKPDMTPLEVEAEKALIARRKAETGESEAALADAESFNKSISNFTSAGGVIDYNKALNEYVRGGGSNKSYLEFLRTGQELEQEARDAGRKPEIKSIIVGDPKTGFRALVQDDRIIQATPIRGLDDPSNVRSQNAKIELLTQAREDYLSGDPERMAKAEIQVLAADIKGEFGSQLTAKDLFGSDAVNKNDNSGTGNDQTPNPNTLTPEERLAFRERYLNNQQ